jgi:hypothetical protein
MACEHCFVYAKHASNISYLAVISYEPLIIQPFPSKDTYTLHRHCAQPQSARCHGTQYQDSHHVRACGEGGSIRSEVDDRALQVVGVSLSQ